MHLFSFWKFQFQTGSIKSLDEKYQRDRKIRFNSKLVRLKACSNAGKRADRVVFNSKLVRLKAGRSSDFPPVSRSFQFQTGSIKRRDRCVARDNASWRFNSKLVRLKACRGNDDRSALRSFNSKLVRLKGSFHDGYSQSECVSIPNWFD